MAAHYCRKAHVHVTAEERAACDYPQEPPKCETWNFHVFTLGGSRCSVCGWDRYR